MNRGQDRRKLFATHLPDAAALQQLLARVLLCSPKRSSTAEIRGGKSVGGLRPLLLCIQDESGESRHKTMLERHGYRVIAVSSTREGLSVFNKNAVDAIIVDVQAPGPSAGTIVRRMKEIKPHVPVLLVRPSAKVPSGRIPTGDAVVLKNDAPVRVLEALDDLLNVRFPFFIRWFGNWKYRAGA